MSENTCDEIYKVLVGDTLYDIANKFSLTVEDLLEANPMIVDQNKIIVGQSLVIPCCQDVGNGNIDQLQYPPSQEQQGYCNFIKHIVKIGDTLSQIAQEYEVDLDDVISANPQLEDPNLIYPGQSITIPKCSNEVRVSTYAKYVVKAGDTLSSIAQQFGVPLQDIINANTDIQNPDLIFVGQVLRIPVDNLDEPCVSQYTVIAGDTLTSIAQIYGVSIQDILNANTDIGDPDEIFVGQVINIPASCEQQIIPVGEPKEFSKQMFIECGKFVDTYDALVEAMNQLNVQFSGPNEAAMFMAQIRHEGTTDPTNTNEFCSSGVPPCGDAYAGKCEWNPVGDPIPGKYYYGRGPIQLTWVCNYQAAGDALGIDLVNDPDLITSDDVIAWKTALWYWFTGSDSPHQYALQNNFAGTTKAINGALECGNYEKQRQRVSYYIEISACMGVHPISEQLYC
eukprot:TRINITY_DN26981_c0_g1_i2.p1 TRINITY_DN26981_c0_g1~~TRINITY_DN26981_c0_g1_i2.p1  ORF type:complete len:452 (-),score=37.67 TRINITY_DN26981_c0_g1_i2:270-1625(-)